LYYWLFIYWSN